ncbi:MAG: sugar phosphate nucleotidyltransferase [Candidatus Wildermuthbacteria bacterium]|nr:sugar phosphate nucleotidyltransferase [Candidatus Wildermuthbacteria bacterium]
MQAVIIAAGLGKRMRPLTLKKPKPLLNIAGKPVLRRTLDQLAGLVDEVILVVGYKGKMIKQRFGSLYKDMRIRYVWQKNPLGTGAAAKKAFPYLKGDFLLLHGDDLYERKDIQKVLKKRPSILLGRVKNPSQFGVVETKGKRVESITEKPKNPKSTLVNTGMYCLPLSVLKTNIKKSKRGEYEFTDYVEQFVKKNALFFFVTKNWIPLSTPQSLEEVRKILARKKK